MPDKRIYAAVEGGTWLTSAPNPHVDLDGAVPAGYPIGQICSDAMANGDSGTFSIHDSSDNGKFGIYRNVTFTTGTPNILDLSSAVLLEAGPNGVPVNNDTVVVIGIDASGITTRAEINTAISGSKIQEGRVYYVSDENHFVIGTSPTTIEEYLKTSTTPADIGALSAVIDDTAPVLGGDLQVGGASNYDIDFTDASNIVQGSIAYLPTENGIGMGSRPAGEPYQETDGGFFMKAGQSEAHGTSFVINGLQHNDSAGYQNLNITPQGIVYGASPPETGWSDSATSTMVHNFGNDKTQGPWVQVTGLSINPVSDVSAGDRIDISVTLRVENTEDKTGNIGIGFGINGADPTEPSITRSVPGESDVRIAVSLSSTGHGGLVTTDTVDIFARREPSTDDANIYLRGDLSSHEQILSVPGGGGGGGSPTNITISYTGTNVTVESSTGTNGIINAAVSGGNAGVLTGADKALLDSAIQPSGGTLTDVGFTEQALGTVGGGTSAVDLDNGHVVTGTLNNDQTINFTSTAGHAAMQWTCTLNTAGFTPTWQFGGVAIDLPDGYDITGSPSRIEFSFIRTSLGVSVTERKIT